MKESVSEFRARRTSNADLATWLTANLDRLAVGLREPLPSPASFYEKFLLIEARDRLARSHRKAHICFWLGIITCAIVLELLRYPCLSG